MKKFDKNLLDPGNIGMTDLEVFLEMKYPGYGITIAGCLQENEVFLNYFKETCMEPFSSPDRFLQWKNYITGLMGIDYILENLGTNLRQFFRNETIQ